MVSPAFIRCNTKIPKAVLLLDVLQRLNGRLEDFFSQFSMITRIKKRVMHRSNDLFRLRKIPVCWSLSIRVGRGERNHDRMYQMIGLEGVDSNRSECLRSSDKSLMCSSAWYVTTPCKMMQHMRSIMKAKKRLIFMSRLSERRAAVVFCRIVLERW